MMTRWSRPEYLLGPAPFNVTQNGQDDAPRPGVRRLPRSGRDVSSTTPEQSAGLWVASQTGCARGSRERQAEVHPARRRAAKGRKPRL